VRSSSVMRCSIWFILSSSFFAFAVMARMDGGRKLKLRVDNGGVGCVQRTFVRKGGALCEQPQVTGGQFRGVFQLLAFARVDLGDLFLPALARIDQVRIRLDLSRMTLK